MTKKEYYETITPENAALVLVDHQIGLYTGVRDIPIDELKHNVIDASGAFTTKQGELGTARMIQAGVKTVGYSNVIVEMLRDNASPLAMEVYGGLDMPFASLVYGLNQYFSKK